MLSLLFGNEWHLFNRTNAEYLNLPNFSFSIGLQPKRPWAGKSRKLKALKQKNIIVF